MKHSCITKALLVTLFTIGAAAQASEQAKEAEIKIKVSTSTDQQKPTTPERQTMEGHLKNAGKNLAYCLGPAFCGALFTMASKNFTNSSLDIDSVILGRGLSRIGLLTMLAITGKLLWNAGHSLHKSINKPTDQLVEDTPYVSSFGKWSSASLCSIQLAAFIVGAIGCLNLRSIGL